MRFDDILAGSRYRIATAEVERDAVVRFAAEWDPQPFHLSDEGARANPLMGRLSASGWQTVLLMQMACDSFVRSTGLVGLAGGGVDEIRWLRPVFPPERLTIWLTFADARASRSRPELGIVTFRLDAYGLDSTQVATMAIKGFFAR